MEFILHLPQDIDKDGALWQIWNSFCQKLKFFQSTDLPGTALMDASSLLLFAAHDQINSICSSLKIYDLDMPKLSKILQVVEQACLPYFILLFERFRYFSLKRELSDSLDDFAHILRKQAEICEFGNLKDSIIKNALCNSLKIESLAQHLPNCDGLHVDENIGHFGQTGSPHRVKANKAESTSSMSKITGDSDFEIFSLSSPALDITSGIKSKKINDNTNHSAFNSGKEQHHTSPTTDEENFEELTEKLNSRKIMEMAKNKRAEKLRNLFVENMGASAATKCEKNDKSNMFSSHCNKSNASYNMRLSSTLLNIQRQGTNLMLLTKYHCCFCEKTFVGRNCLRKHLVLKHKGSTKFTCKICTAVLLDIEQYLMHNENEHFTKQQLPKLSTLPSLKLRVKRDTEKFHCSYCRRVFVKEGYLKRHIYYSHAKRFICWHCGEDFQSLSEYKQHSEKHVVVGRFSCDLCQRQLNSIFRLSGHLKNHLMPRNNCKICGVVFSKQESLARHIKKHVDEPVHICKICGKSFVVEARLQYHMRTHSGEKRFTCELCGKMYAQKINLVYHKLWHTGEQPFECEICGKRTRSPGDLSKHKRKHSDKYSYVCEVCGRGFNYSSALAKHRMGHTGKRSYACEVCGRTYIYREGLRDHIKASRCPGIKSETSFNRTRATKLLHSGMTNNPPDVEPKVLGQARSQRASDTGLKEIQDWRCMLRSNEADAGTSVVLVPSFY